MPAEHGAVVNVTRSSGVAERYPRWSPDGKTLAYWSDRSGEYELTLRPADGSGAETKVTTLGPGFRYAPQWSPDSKKLAFIDQAMRIRVYDVDAQGDDEVDQSPEWISHGDARGVPLRVVARLALARVRAAGRRRSNNAIFLYDTEDRHAASGDERATSTTRSRRSIPKASTCSTRPIARSSRSTAGSTTRGPTRTRRSSWAPPLRKTCSRRSRARNDAEKTTDGDKSDDKKDDDKNDEKPDDKKDDETTSPTVQDSASDRGTAAEAEEHGPTTGKPDCEGRKAREANHRLPR